MTEAQFSISWGAVQNSIYVMLIVGVALLCLVYRIKRSNQTFKLLANSKLAHLFIMHFSPTKNILKLIFFMLGLFFLTITLLHPQWNKKEETITQEGRDLFIALDISRSMLATDCLPNRLECAKAKIKKLVKQLKSERVGLILFSGSAFVQCPLTSDYSAFFMFLDQVDAETISSGSTAFDAALYKILEAFGTAEKRKNKLAVLFTDGEDFSSNLSVVKKQAQEENLHLFTFGVGTPQGAPIPLFDEQGKQIGHQKDKKGSVVISRLNEGILSALATDSGGTYIHLTPDSNADINSLIKKVESYEKEKFEDKKIAKMEEQYPYFLAISLLFFALEWII